MKGELEAKVDHKDEEWLIGLYYSRSLLCLHVVNFVVYLVGYECITLNHEVELAKKTQVSLTFMLGIHMHYVNIWLI